MNRISVLCFPFAFNHWVAMQRFIVILFTMLALTACQRSDPNSPVSLRKATFKEMLKSREAMGAMLNGNKPFKSEAFIQEAVKLNAKSKQPWAYFPEFAAQNAAKADAKDFHAAADNMEQQSAALLAAAQSGKEDRIRASYKAVENACIRCHQQFRPG